jgi:hypothetical protein
MAKAVISAPVNVHVADHSFGLFDQHEIPVHTADWSNGLIVTMSSGAMIYTGIDRGHVRVTTDVRSTAPDAIDTGPWDDIIEASLIAPHGQLGVECLEYRPEQGAPNLPLLSSRGPGSYRLRAHVRGRDLHYDAVQNEPTEDYLLQIWPAEPSPQLIIRATDRCGYGLRLSDTQRPRSAPTPQPPPEQLARDKNRAKLRQAILDGVSQANPANPTPDRQPPP